MNTFADGIEAAAKCAEEYGRMSLSAERRAMFWATCGNIAHQIRRLTPPAPEPVADQSEAVTRVRATIKRLKLAHDFDGEFAIPDRAECIAFANDLETLVARGTRTPGTVEIKPIPSGYRMCKVCDYIFMPRDAECPNCRAEIELDRAGRDG